MTSTHIQVVLKELQNDWEKFCYRRS
jgi:hypothetical protein